MKISKFFLVLGTALLSIVLFAQQPRVDKKGRLISMDEVDLFSGVQSIPNTNIFSDPLYNIWCGSVVKGNNGAFYMFYSRWPIAEGHYAWLPSSEICLAKSDKPAGPYKHVKVVLPRRGAQYWDGITTHNPAAIVYKGKYYLTYMGTTGTKEVKMPALMNDPNWWEYRNNQRIGMAVADDPEGEWTRFDKPVIDVSPDSTAHDALMMANPAITVDEKGRAVLVYKQVAKNGTLRGGKVRFGVAFSNSLLGPYTKSPTPIFEHNNGGESWMVAEDPFIWNYKNVYYAIVSDVVGLFTNKEAGLAMLRSDDAIHWTPAKFPKVVPHRLTYDDNRACDARIERPCLYVEKGVPMYLYGAQSFNKRAVSVNVAVPLKWIDSTKILVPRITGEWKHIYRPQGDFFPGPDSKRFKTGQYCPNWQVNDHYILKGKDNRWHAIGISHPTVEAGPDEKEPHEAEWFSFHAVSGKGKLTDNLTPGSWLDKARILPPSERPGEIKENHAPHIIPYKKGYYMVYGCSPIRYAISDDLYNWKPMGKLFHEPENARDPFILLHNNLYYMSYTTMQRVMVRTSSDLLKWSEPVTIFELPEGETGGAESTQLIPMNGGFYLIFCRWDAKLKNFTYQDKSYVYYSDDLLNFKNRKPIAEIAGHAPEFFQDEKGNWWISSAERPYRGVSIAPVSWQPLK